MKKIKINNLSNLEDFLKEIDLPYHREKSYITFVDASNRGVQISSSPDYNFTISQDSNGPNLDDSFDWAIKCDEIAIMDYEGEENFIQMDLLINNDVIAELTLWDIVEKTKMSQTEMEAYWEDNYSEEDDGFNDIGISEEA